MQRLLQKRAEVCSKWFKGQQTLEVEVLRLVSMQER